MPPEERSGETLDQDDATAAPVNTKPRRVTPATRKQSEPEYDEYDESFENPPFLMVMGAYMCLSLFVIFGHLREFLRRIGLDGTMDTTEYGNSVSHTKEAVNK